MGLAGLNYGFIAQEIDLDSSKLNALGSRRYTDKMCTRQELDRANGMPLGGHVHMTSARIEVREERVGSKVDNSTDRLRECDSDDKGVSFADVICTPQ